MIIKMYSLQILIFNLLMWSTLEVLSKLLSSWTCIPS